MGKLLDCLILVMYELSKGCLIGLIECCIFFRSIVLLKCDV